MKVLAIAGSLRADSHNRRLIEAAAALIAARGVEVEILDPEALRSLPHFDQDLEADAPEPVERLRGKIEAADGLLLATPEYNGSIPSVLKNAVDWASRPRENAALKNKPVIVIGASVMPFGAVWAQAELRKVLGAAGARVVDGELALGTAAEAFHAEPSDARHLVADENHETLDGVVAALIASIEARADRETAEAVLTGAAA
jgi:chromate reductase